MSERSDSAFKSVKVSNDRGNVVYRYCVCLRKVLERHEMHASVDERSGLKPISPA
jgi:hypothetical protein